MKSNQHRKTKQANGAPLYKAKFEDLQEDYSQLQGNHSALEKRNSALSESFETSLNEKLNLESSCRYKERQVQELRYIVTAKAAIASVLNDELKESDHHRTMWRNSFFVLAAIVISFPVWGL